jgi:gliding motility-associated-like protein
VNGSVPKAIFTVQNDKICSGGEIVFEDKATLNFGEITRIEWYYDYGNEPAVVQVDEHPENRAAAARQYKHIYPLFHSPAIKPVTVRMLVYSGISCVDEQQMNLNVLAVPEVDFGPLSPVCEESQAFRLTQGKEIWGLLTGTEKYSGPGVNGQGLFDPAVAGAGTHLISYLFTADNDCSSSVKTQTITVYPKPTVNAGNDETILQDGQIQLKANATGSNLRYKWTPSTSLDRDDIPNPIVAPTNDITYKLTVTTDQGCSASDQVFIQVFRNPEIPNAFTPNGDNINDNWNIKYLSSYPNATVNVYNRYGEKVFSSRTTGTKNWDGKYGGVDVPVGTYYYVIDPHNGRKLMTGALTVLR